MNINTKAIVEGVKELLRIALFGALTAATGWLAQKVNLLDPTSLYYIVGTLALRFLDKVVHKNENISVNGISPF